jgi:hypothetical protein
MNQLPPLNTLSSQQKDELIHKRIQKSVFGLRQSPGVERS